jgi:hypothetical protein
MPYALVRMPRSLTACRSPSTTRPSSTRQHTSAYVSIRQHTHSPLAHRLPLPIHDAPVQQEAHVVQQSPGILPPLRCQHLYFSTSKALQQVAHVVQQSPASCPSSGVSICTIVLVKLVSMRRMRLLLPSFTSAKVQILTPEGVGTAVPHAPLAA